MEKKMNNKGFSLVELIIVVAIMAVLIGVLAPAYLQYVEKSKKTTDASAIGSVLDAIEIVAADPAIDWVAGASTAKTITISSSAVASYDSYGTDKVLEAIDKIADGSKTKLTGSWGKIVFKAEKQANGTVVFTIDGTNSSIKKNGGADGYNLEEISKPLAARFE